MPFDMEPFITKPEPVEAVPEVQPAGAMEALLWVVVLLLIVCAPAIVIAVWGAAL